MEINNEKVYYRYNTQSIIGLCMGIIFLCLELSGMSYISSVLLGIASVLVLLLLIVLIIASLLTIREKVFDIECPHCNKKFAFVYNSESGTCPHCQKHILKTKNGFCCADDIKGDNLNT